MTLWQLALVFSVLIGTASWGDFGGHVVTRNPRGTEIRVCGPKGCWEGKSYGYGPGIPGRIVDLDRKVFVTICGNPGIGLCPVSMVMERGTTK